MAGTLLLKPILEIIEQNYSHLPLGKDMSAFFRPFFRSCVDGPIHFRDYKKNNMII